MSWWMVNSVLCHFRYVSRHSVLAAFVSSSTKRMAGDKFHELYKGKELADNYLRYRLTYPQEVFDVITSYHRQSGHGAWDLAVDVGCGSGQSTFPLVKYFEKVIGMDLSPDQLANCVKSNPKVTFRLGMAEDLSFLEPETVDLITVAAAAHWMDRDRFFSEAYRVLKPQGTLALYSYGVGNFECDAVEHYMDGVYTGVLADYMNVNPDTGSGVFMEKYRHITVPKMEDFKWIEEAAKLEMEWTVERWINYLRSTHFVDKYISKNPEHDLLKEIKEELTKLARSGNEADEDVRIRPKFGIFMVLTRKPL